MKFTTVSDYKQNYNSNYHQEMASGKNLMEETARQRFRTLKYTELGKKGSLTQKEPFQGETMYNTSHQGKGTQSIVLEKPIDSLYLPKEMKILEKISKNNKDYG